MTVPSLSRWMTLTGILLNFSSIFSRLLSGGIYLDLKSVVYRPSGTSSGKFSANQRNGIRTISGRPFSVITKPMSSLSIRSRISSSFSTSCVCSMRSISDSGGSLFILASPYSCCDVLSPEDTGTGFSVPVIKSYSASGSFRQYFMVQSASHTV